MAPKNVYQTPYCYCSNNPLNRIDLDGMDDRESSGNDNIARGTYTNGQQSYTYTGKEGVTEQTLKDFGWTKQPDVNGVKSQQSTDATLAIGGVAGSAGASQGTPSGRVPAGSATSTGGNTGTPSSSGNGGAGAARGGGSGSGGVSTTATRLLRIVRWGSIYISLALTVTGDTRRTPTAKYEPNSNTSSEPSSNVESKTESQPQAEADSDDDEYITLYRGVRGDDYRYNEVDKLGLMRPWGWFIGNYAPESWAHESAAIHNRGLYEGDTDSVFTSWTTDKSIANAHANRGKTKYGPALVLTKRFKKSELTKSPDIYDEKERLVRGIVSGFSKEYAKPIQKK